jgi:hypothetical protein
MSSFDKIFPLRRRCKSANLRKRLFAMIAAADRLALLVLYELPLSPKLHAFRLGDGAAGVLKPCHFIVGKTGFSRFGTVALYEGFKGVEKIGRGVPNAGFLLCALVLNLKVFDLARVVALGATAGAFVVPSVVAASILGSVVSDNDHNLCFDPESVLVAALRATDAFQAVFIRHDFPPSLLVFGCMRSCNLALAAERG